MNLEELISMVNGKEPRYERRGQCIRCGACCIEEDCEYLQWENGFATCSVFDKPERRPYCKDWPELPPIVYKTCGYSFYDKIENKELHYKEL
jgi:hypothetical protein